MASYLRRPSPKRIVIILSLLELLAIYTLWIQIHLNGHYKLMTTLRDHGPHLLPGTSIPLKKEYLGVKSIDYVLTVLVCSFGAIIDGGYVEGKLFVGLIGGVVAAAVVVIWCEGLIAGRGWIK
jgi:hypothetical protein